MTDLVAVLVDVDAARGWQPASTWLLPVAVLAGEVCVDCERSDGDLGVLGAVAPVVPSGRPNDPWRTVRPQPADVAGRVVMAHRACIAVLAAEEQALADWAATYPLRAPAAETPTMGWDADLPGDAVPTTASRPEGLVALTFQTERDAAAVADLIAKFHAAQGAVNETVEAWSNEADTAVDLLDEFRAAQGAERDRIARHLAQRLLAGRVVAPSTVDTDEDDVPTTLPGCPDARGHARELADQIWYGSSGKVVTGILRLAAHDPDSALSIGQELLLELADTLGRIATDPPTLESYDECDHPMHGDDYYPGPA